MVLPFRELGRVMISPQDSVVVKVIGGARFTLKKDSMNFFVCIVALLIANSVIGSVAFMTNF